MYVLVFVLGLMIERIMNRYFIEGYTVEEEGVCHNLCFSDGSCENNRPYGRNNQDGNTCFDCISKCND